MRDKRIKWLRGNITTYLRRTPGVVVSIGTVKVPHEAWEDEAGFGVVLGVPVVRGVAELLRIIAATPEQTCHLGKCDKHAFVLHVSPV